MMRRALFVLLAGIAAAGCGAARVKPDRPADPPPRATAPPPTATAPAGGTSLSVGSARTLSAGNAIFAGRLLALLAHSRTTIALSPFSISDALAMTFAGARGQTASQIASALDYGLPPARLHAQFKALDSSLAEIKQLSVANALWGQRGLGFRQAFLALLARDYGAAMQLADFAGSPQAAIAAINSWVSAHTHKKIADLLQPGDVDRLTRLALVNAVYLNAKWEVPFDRAATASAAFHAPGAVLQLPTLHETADLAYERGRGYSAVELPYRGGRLAFDVLLPDRGALTSLLDRFETRGPVSLLGRLRPQRIALSMPKLHVRTRFELAPALRQLGMRLAFQPRRADLSGIAGAPGLLYVHAVVHEAYLNVDEAGTEAAAATAVTVNATSAVVQQPPIPFDVNRPFLFVLRDRRTNAILFLGLISDPR